MPGGEILVETESRIHADKLQQLTELGTVPVKVTPHRTLNTYKGVIRSRDMAACSVEEIVTELGPQEVTDALVISVKDGNAKRRTNTIILTFALPRPPKHIKAGYIRIHVELYVPNPLRCYNVKSTGTAVKHVAAPQSV